MRDIDLVFVKRLRPTSSGCKAPDEAPIWLARKCSFFDFLMKPIDSLFRPAVALERQSFTAVFFKFFFFSVPYHAGSYLI